MKIRYIKDYLRGHTNNSMNSDWTEIKAIDYEGNNIALGKVVTASGSASWGTFDRVTDGVIGNDVSVGIVSSEKQWVQVDLGSIYNIDYLHIWHYYSSPRRFNDTKVEVSEDGTVWTVIFDSAIEGTYDESSEGRTFRLPYATDLDKLPTTSPLSQVNSQVNNIKNEINAIKNVLKNNLIEKGVECSDTDRTSNLVDKINGIKVGKKAIAGDSIELVNMKHYNNGTLQLASANIVGNFNFFNSAVSGSIRISTYLQKSLSSATANVLIRKISLDGTSLDVRNLQLSSSGSGTFNVDVYVDIGDSIVLQCSVTSGSLDTKYVKVTCDYL